MTETKQKRKPRKYTDEVKQQLVDLYHSGKRRCDICREYDIAHSLFDKWVKQAENSGSFHEKDNRTPEQEELLKLRKENQQLKMENDILKQAALILGNLQRRASPQHKKKYQPRPGGVFGAYKFSMAIPYIKYPLKCSHGLLPELYFLTDIDFCPATLRGVCICQYNAIPLI